MDISGYVRDEKVDVTCYNGIRTPFVGSLKEARKVSLAMAHMYGHYKYAPVRLIKNGEFIGYGVSIFGHVPINDFHALKIMQRYKLTSN